MLYLILSFIWLSPLLQDANNVFGTGLALKQIAIKVRSDNGCGYIVMWERVGSITSILT